MLDAIAVEVVTEGQSGSVKSPSCLPDEPYTVQLCMLVIERFQDLIIYFFAQAASPLVADVCQHVARLAPTGGSPTRLSMQFPGCPTRSVHRMMMLVSRLLPAQKAPLGFDAGQVKLPVVELLLRN